MTPGDEYRVRAANLKARAKREAKPSVRAELEGLAQGYLRLAEQAERNSHTDIVYEWVPRAPDATKDPPGDSGSDRDPKFNP
jgi:hypothetical protein